MIQPAEWDRFFAKFSERGNITEACKASGIARCTVYEYRDGKVPEGVDGAAWKARFAEALEESMDRLEAEAYRRAVEGVEEPLIGRVAKDQDGVITTVRKYSDGLLTLLLKAHRPDKFKDRVANELTGKDGGPIQTQKVIAIPVIEEGAEE